LQDLISRKFMNARWYAYEPVDSDIHQRAATMAFSPMKVMGVTSPSVRPVYHFEKAKVIVSLGSDFLGSEDDVHNHIRRYVQGRKPESGGIAVHPDRGRSGPPVARAAQSNGHPGPGLV
jgi:molybdopterin-containing oxidoreductase family iron-sulfur binding subunit